MIITTRDELAASNYARDEFGDKVKNFDDSYDDFLAGVLYLKNILNDEALKKIRNICDEAANKRHEYTHGLSDAYNEIRKILFDLN